VHLHIPHAPLAHTINHHLPLGRRGIPPALAQHLTPLRRQLPEAVEVLPHGILLIRRQRLKPLPTLSQGIALIRRQIVPTLKTLLSLPTLIR